MNLTLFVLKSVPSTVILFFTGRVNSKGMLGRIDHPPRLLNEERDSSLEVVDNNADVVYPKCRF
jgi:hypothetical protein